MADNSYYFSHDYNARTDPKIKKMLARHGIAGYGIYWAIIEDLYNNANALPTDYETIAYDLRTDCETVKSIINDFELFEIAGDYFGSLSVERRLNERRDKSDKARQSAISRWSSSTEKNANALRTHTDSNAIKGKDNKIKDIKEDSIGNACPYDEILSLYHSLCPSLPAVAKLSDSRKEKVRLRFAEMDRKIETLQVVFENVENSEFCKGKTDRGWTASFDWIFENDKNWLKIYEGKYANKSVEEEGVNYHWNKPEKLNRHREVTCQPGDNRGSSTL